MRVPKAESLILNALFQLITTANDVSKSESHKLWRLGALQQPFYSCFANDSEPFRWPASVLTSKDLWQGIGGSAANNVMPHTGMFA